MGALAGLIGAVATGLRVAKEVTNKAGIRKTQMMLQQAGMSKDSRNKIHDFMCVANVAFDEKDEIKQVLKDGHLMQGAVRTAALGKWLMSKTKDVLFSR